MILMKKMEMIGFQEHRQQAVKQQESQKELHGKPQRLHKRLLENLYLEEKSTKAQRKVIENKEDEF